MRRSGFASGEGLVVTAVLAIWVAISWPIYAHYIQYLQRKGISPGWGEHVLGGVVAILTPALLVGLWAGAAWLWEKVTDRFGR